MGSGRRTNEQINKNMNSCICVFLPFFLTFPTESRNAHKINLFENGCVDYIGLTNNFTALESKNYIEEFWVFNAELRKMEQNS